MFIDELRINYVKKDVDNLFIEMSKSFYGIYFQFRGQEFEGMIRAMYNLGIINFGECTFLQECHSVLIDLKIEDLKEW